MGLLKLTDIGLKMTGAVADISIPLQFDGPQPNHFGASPAHAEPMRANGFTGDTRKGGSCNAFSVTLNPHCNGTHTECVGHVTTTRVSINEICPAVPLLAAVVSVAPRPVTYDGSAAHSVSRRDLEPEVNEVFSRVSASNAMTPTALVIRTLPNLEDKQTKAYERTSDSAYLEVDAIEWLVDQGIDHLLVDVPSIDPHSDNGELAAHRAMFGLPSRALCPEPTLDDARRPHATVTELVYIGDHIADGLYLLNLQIPPFCLDAAPSRPLLYTLESA